MDASPNPHCPGCQALLKRVAHLEEEVRQLRALVEELRAALRRNSSNSNRPPSSDSPSQRAERPSQPPSGRKPGGQPGHEAHQRALLPPEQVTRHVRRDVLRCRRCSAPLATARELDPLRHQVLEIPPIAPEVTEYVLNRRCCRKCGTISTAPLPMGVPQGMCGPQLSALITLLTGVYHLSRRNAAALLDDVLGVKLALGTVSNVEERMAEALGGAHAEAISVVQRARVKHLDATSWSQSGEPRSLWTFASRKATAYVITANATTQCVREFVGATRGTLVTDRGSQFGFWAMEQRQICWAHLLRRIAAFLENPRSDVQQLGQDLLLLSQVHLSQWHSFRDGIKTRQSLKDLVGRLEPIFVAHLERGARLGVRDVSGTCANLLAHRDALFTYAFVEGVPPTNNHAEQALRGFVMWRKQTAGTRSERGDRFAERIMTVVHTLRKRGRHALSYLEDACVAALHNKPSLSLMASGP